MAIWAELDLSGIAPGDSITADNTGNFFDMGYPTEGYLTAATVIGGDIGMRPRSTGWANAGKSLGDHSDEGRIGYKVQFINQGAATSYAEILGLRTDSTILWDTGLRNATGTREMGARNNFTYVGQANGSPMLADDQWSVEVYWLGSEATIYVWDSPDTTGVPTYTWGPSTMATVPDNIFMLPDSADGVDFIVYDVWISDGERREGTPIPGTLTLLSNIYASQDEIILVGKVADAEEVSLSVGANSSFASLDADGYFRASLSGLSPDTAQAWELSIDGAVAKTGTVRTLPTSADGLTFLWGSCFDSYTSQFFNLADARNPNFIVNLGDWGYQYITGGANGNVSPTDVATVRAHREAVLSAPGPQGLFTKYPTSYTYSDCDGAGANSDGTTGGHATGAVQAAYRQQFAHPTLPLQDSGARSWVVGRVRFIHTDETVQASPKADPDTASKTKLGAEQKSWFKAEIDAAVAQDQAVVWFGDGPWISPAQVTGNEWRAYNTERTEIGNYIESSGVKLVRLHGDTHTLFADDGTANQWGGFPTASAAPFHTTANPYGVTVSGGKWPETQTNSSRQYGVAEISDSGGKISLTIRGFSSTNSAPTEVERFNETFDITPGGAVNNQPWDAVLVGTQPADAVYVGSTLVWGQVAN